MDVDDFDFALPDALIAQEPLAQRDASRLLVLPRESVPTAPGAVARDAGALGLEHRWVRELPSLLRAGDLLVVNDARVVPARLTGRKRGSGGKVELLFVEPLADNGGGEWLALGQSSKPMRVAQMIDLDGPGGHAVEIAEVRGGGELRVRLPAVLSSNESVFAFLDAAGSLPLPPYIERAPAEADRERYQTLFARVPGAVAAPTAGLHFTPALLEELRARGVERASVTLHVGPGTFLPVRATRIEEHKMHRERYEVPRETAEAFARARARGGRVIAVGTTALRTLEAAWNDLTESSGHDSGLAGRGSARSSGALRVGAGATNLFCTPGYQFRAVDGLFTNFHLPKSTLLMLVAAFAGMDRTLDAYRIAVEQQYRFFSYGDAMFIS